MALAFQALRSDDDLDIDRQRIEQRTYLLNTHPDLVRYLPLLPGHTSFSQFRIGVYDCLYVALAEQEKCDLVTADSRLISSLAQHFPLIFDLATLP